jgi:hypothetical protein
MSSKPGTAGGSRIGLLGCQTFGGVNMEISLRPWLTTGVALIGAGAIALAPIQPITASPLMAPTAVVAPTVHTTAFEIPYILTLPVVRQSIANDIYLWAVLLNGWGQAGVGALHTLDAIPPTVVTITQQLLQLDFVGAFNTLSSAITAGVIAVGQPLLDSLIERRQTTLAIQTALQAAVPEAFFTVVNSVLAASNTVVTSAIVGTQDLVRAIATLDLSNIVDAAVAGTKGFVTALGQGAGDIVTGVETAQKTLVTALATRAPTGSAAAAKQVGAVPDLSAKTVTLSVTAPKTGGQAKSAPAAAPGTSGAGVAATTKRAAHHNTGHAKAAGNTASSRTSAGQGSK